MYQSSYAAAWYLTESPEWDHSITPGCAAQALLRLPVFHLLSASLLLLSPLLLRLLLLLPAFFFSPAGGVIKSHITDDQRAALTARC